MAGHQTQGARDVPVSRSYSHSSEETLSTAARPGSVPIKSNVRMLYSRVQTMLRQRRRKQKRSLEISAPFDLKREPVCLPGVTEDDLCILRDKAAASCIGIAEAISRSPSEMLLSQTARSPMAPRLPSSATAPMRVSAV